MAINRLLSLGIIAVLGAATATAFASPAVAAPPQPAPTQTRPLSVPDPSLSATPYQGWNTYFGLGGDFTEAEVLEVADHLVSSGLSKAGYDIVWLDGGWQALVRALAT